jgi:hypothetical protein
LTPACRRLAKARTNLGHTGRMDEAALDRLTNTFESLGADDASGWASSEIREKIPQLARFLVLRLLWRYAIDVWATATELDSVPAARRLLTTGADRADLVRLARHAAYAAVHSTLYRIDEGYDPDADAAMDGLPGWQLMEVMEIDRSGEVELTGRVVNDLHESILTMDPSGQEGRDLWE